MGREEGQCSIKAAKGQPTHQQRPRGSCDIPEMMSAHSPRSTQICFHLNPFYSLDWSGTHAFYVGYTTRSALQEMTDKP